jgi:drug/metabolite transporter (DMT)-like permease
MDRYAQGILLISLSAVAYSSAGFFTRLIHLDAWTMLFWRGLFAGLMILCVIAVQERRNTWGAIRAIGRPGIVAAGCSTAATLFYINALRHSSVADVAVIFAAAPFLTAGLGWLWLGVTEAWTTLAASVVAVLGVTIMVGGAVADGHLFGDVLAFGMTLCMAIMMLIIREHRETPMLPAACLSALLCPLVVWPFAAPLDVARGDVGNLFLFGTTQFGLGLVFLTVGGQMVSATENALINTLETPLAIAWVWVCFGETPSLASVLGGIIVMAAVAAHVWHSNRSRPDRSGAVPLARKGDRVHGQAH